MEMDFLLFPLILCHYCPDLHRDKLQQESSFFENPSGFRLSPAFAEAATRRQAGMTALLFK